MTGGSGFWREHAEPLRGAGLLAVLLAFVLGACAPRIAPAGPGGEAPPALFDERLRTGDGLSLPLRRWAPEDGAAKAVIVALHGFNDYAMGFDSPASWLAAQGYGVYAYDQRGFGAAPHAGLWGGTGRLVDDFATAVELIKARYPDTPVYGLGTSMGGAVILAAAGRGQLPELDGTILAAPAIWARQTMPFYQRWALWLTVRVAPWMTLTGRDLGIQASDNLIELRALGADPLVIKSTRVDAMYGLTDLMSEAFASAPALPGPALVLYGERDEVVPPGPTLRFWGQIEETPGVTTALYDEGWHLLLRDLQADTVWRDIAAWIDAGPESGAPTPAPLPSAADARARTALALGRLPVPDDAPMAAEVAGLDEGAAAPERQGAPEDAD